MSEMSPIIAELERMVGLIVSAFGGNMPAGVLNMPLPIVSVASRGRASGILGWYVPPTWNDTPDSALDIVSGGKISEVKVIKRAELVIASEALNRSSAVVSELARLMLQHWGVVAPVKPGVWYFGQGFPQEAWRVGHTAGVEKGAENKGYRAWTPKKEFKDEVLAKLNTMPFELHKGAARERKPVGSRMRKWACGCTVIRSATWVDATCNKCNRDFRWAEGFAALKQALFTTPSSQSYEAGAWARVVGQLLPTGWVTDEKNRRVGCDACQMMKGNGEVCDGEGPGTMNEQCPAYVALAAGSHPSSGSVSHMTVING